MYTMETAVLIGLLLLTATASLPAQAPDISGAPKAIQELSASMQGKDPSVVRAAIIKRFGPAQRSVGSGVLIEQWDVSGGVLTFHPSAGPTFLDPKAKTTYHLMRTTNPVLVNLLQSYDMTTLPDPENHGNRFWLGNVQLIADRTYRFIESGQSKKYQSAQGENFFMLHPAGKFEIRYAPSIKPDTLLESVPEGATIAHLVFTSSDGKHEATFFLASYEQTRWLKFGADKPISFCLETGWKSDWR